MQVHFEHTDTFGGEANYSWVNRGTLTLPDNASDLTIVRAVKKELGLSGVKCDRDKYLGNDDIVLRPRRICQIIFITFE